nr:SDR family oxidoreductase [Candidatus Sigynarchaeota archaeon]
MGDRLDGKNILITGAASGIGRSMAILFAQEGANLALNDKNEAGLVETAKLAKENGLKMDALLLPADVSDSEQVQAMEQKYFATFGTLDVLVNNAGIGGPMSRIVSTKEDDWDQVMRINLRSVFLVSKYFAKKMMKRDAPEDQLRGKIINMSSARGKKGRALFGAYSVSKFGVVSLTQTLALELGPSRITVNCICPGVIATPIYGVATPEALAQANEWEQPCLKYKPVGFPEDVARVALFLASSDSDYMTGQSLMVTGGRQFV